MVVQARDGGLVGVLHAVSLPGRVVADAADRGVPLELTMEALTAVVKIRAVAVEEAVRGQGAASALLTRTLQWYFQLGFRMAYGQFHVGSGLEGFYTRLGFQVLDAGIPLDLYDSLGLPFKVYPEAEDRIFACLNDR